MMSPCTHNHRHYICILQIGKTWNVLRMLRIILSKFTKSDPLLPAWFWGPPYRGTETLTAHSRPEQEYHNLVLSHDMPLRTARRVLDEIDPNTPWRTALDFLRCLAAFSAVHREELRRRTHVAGAPLRRLIWNAGVPSRLQWYFNGLRMIHSFPTHQRALLCAGTTANEAYHSEINTWMRNQSEVVIRVPFPYQ